MTSHNTGKPPTSMKQGHRNSSESRKTHAHSTETHKCSQRSHIQSNGFCPLDEQRPKETEEKERKRETLAQGK